MGGIFPLVLTKNNYCLRHTLLSVYYSGAHMAMIVSTLTKAVQFGTQLESVFIAGKWTPPYIVVWPNEFSHLGKTKWQERTHASIAVPYMYFHYRIRKWDRLLENINYYNSTM